MKLKRKSLLILGLAIFLVLAMSVSAMAVEDLDTFPAEVDPQSWQASEDMSWDQWKDNPVIDWTTVDLPNADVKTGVLIMVDFADLPFIMTQPTGSDFMGNPTSEPITEDEVCDYWTELLNIPSELNDYTSIDGFWRENSYGKWAVEIEAYGPYHLDGMEWEYGLDYMNGGTGKRNIINEALAAFIADVEGRGGKDLSDFDFGFIVHAGYTESAVWQEAGEMMFATKEDVPEDFGPTVAELEAIKAWGAKPQGSAEPIEDNRGRVTNDISGWSMFFDGVDPDTGEFLITDATEGANWAPTRYVEWTSFKAAKTVWSFTSSYTAKEGDGTGLEPGARWRISVQSEDNGMGTFAHEFGHISGISDNYVSAYTDPPQRTPAGNWELMNAGNQNGPGGTHARYTIPARAGDVVPAEHTVRLKVKQGFYDEGQTTEVGQDALIADGPVFETVVARNVPTTGEYGVGYGKNALILDLTEDKTPIVKTSDPDYIWNNVATYGGNPGENGYYENYGIEVIQRTGYESFMNDEGVLITMYRETESPPFIWVIDSHPEDINIVNFKNPATGEDVYITKGENRQLLDALFHAGTGEDVVSEYYDEYNKLHFYILEKMYDEDGVLSYRVAIRSEETDAATYSDAMEVTLGAVSEAEPGKVAVQEIRIKNNGTDTGLYRLSSENEKDWEWLLSYEVIEVEPGETVTVPLYVEVPEYRVKANDFTFTVSSEVSKNEVTVDGTITPLEGEGEGPGYEGYDDVTQSVMPEVTGGDAQALPDVDPVSWAVPEWMTWADWNDNPAIDWTEEDLPNATLQKGLVILVDYADRPFVMTQPVGSDPLKNPQIQVAEEDLAEWWENYLNVPSELNNWTSIDAFWRENSYGNWKVEIDAYGPYTLDGMEWEYGIDYMNGSRYSRDIGLESMALFLEENPGFDLSDYNFAFIVHAGYDESGVWQEAGEMMFESPEAIPDEFGPTEEELEAIKALGEQEVDISWADHLFEGENWIVSRYVPWTSWLAAKSVWSHTTYAYKGQGEAIDGLPEGAGFNISVQGENDGMGTFAHEFGHIREIADNYNNPYDPSENRSYTGVWELMSRGSFAGPEGTHTRWQIPSLNGASAPAPHTTRLKLKQEFYTDDQYTRVDEAKDLIANGPVFETIVAREVPTAGQWGIGYGVNSLMIDMDVDNTPIVTKNDPEYNWQTSTWGSYNESNPYYGEGYYQFYSMEVVQQVGYDSFSPDEGVLIIMNREIDNERAPYMWVIDANPDDINLVDFERPDGTDAMVSKGDARQLADALFHAGTGEGVVSEYYDEYNNLHFYVLDKMYDEQGVLSYRVAVRSDEFTGNYSDAMEVTLGAVSEAEPGNVAVQEILITNTGTQPGLYRVAGENVEGWEDAVAANVIEVEPGETVSIGYYMEVPEYRAKANDFEFTVSSEVSENEATVEGTITPPEGEAPGYDKYDGVTQSVMPEVTGGDVRELPDVDPVSWAVPEWMTWADWSDNPVMDWMEEDLPNATLQKGLVILVDYSDKEFVMTQPVGSDPLKNPQIQVAEEDLAEWWENYLNVPSELNNWTSIDAFWRENSYGNWKVEIDAYGPYTLDGMEWEYGIDYMNGSRYSRDIGLESMDLFLEENPGFDLSDYNFAFIVHAGYDESGVWQEAGEMMFESPEAVPDEFGPTEEELEAIKALGEQEVDISWADHLFEGENWIVSRYVPWTSWLAAKSVWSHTTYAYKGQGEAIDGLPEGAGFNISVQGENDGMGTFAHEFGHIREIADNYNNPYDPSENRSYTGVWELMSRGSFAGPEGTHTRWQIPSLNGASAPAPHTTRLKLKQDFYTDDQYARVDEAKDLIANGPVFETIVAREVPTAGQWGIGYGVNSLMIDMDVDNTPIVTKNDPEYNWQTSTWGSYNERNPYYGEGYYQFYSMEVVQQVGYDSFSPDEGVLIIMNREIDNERAPYMWVIDANPDDINLVDFERPDGTDAMVSKGDARQLADALFHAGTGEGVVSEYFDEYNNLHFYVLDKMYDEQGVLSYRVAVRSDEFTGNYSDSFTVQVGDCSPAKAGNVAVQEILITNTGTQPGLYRVAGENVEGWEDAVVANVIEVPAGETVAVGYYMEVPDFRPADNDFTFTVTSEVNGTEKSVSGTVEPQGGSGATDTTRPDRPSRPDRDEDDEDEEIEVPEVVLPFVDVAKSAWYYNDVLIAWQDGLVNGRTVTTYVPDGNITVAEAIKLAATMHQKYTTGTVTLSNGSPEWYSTYVAYAVANGIIQEGEYTNLNAVATRAQFASIFAAALPAEALKAINTVEDGKIPDVKLSDSYGAAVYKLYQAGVLTGNDEAGTFAPMTSIKRSEVAAIVNRMMHEDSRKTLAL